MELKKIIISNFKCIDNLEIPISKINGSKTYTLIGVNESGKSSILTAISLFKTKILKFPLDFNDSTKPVSVKLEYELSKEDIDEFKEKFEEVYQVEPSFSRKIKIHKITITNNILPQTTITSSIGQELEIDDYTFEGYKLTADKIEKTEEVLNLDLRQLIEAKFSNYFITLKHNIILWKSEPKFLISGVIDLAQFSTNPLELSLPLMNCFRLIGIEEADLPAEIAKLVNPQDAHNLVQRLNDSVTEHIKKVWPKHPILIRFQINANKISFLVEDVGVKYKAKETSQRSDGFRQFISFLLTISIENSNESLNNTILLLDEPEIHLHPQAQINLMNELIEISKRSESNNIVFYATHSSYMIDRSNLNRSILVVKKDNEKTITHNINKTKSSYSEINYEAFGIATNDYHNELYGFIEANDNVQLQALTRDKVWGNSRTRRSENVSLSKYIRHSIHHPENTTNRKFTHLQLVKSIEILRGIKDSIA